jgi:hypothetical protein
MRYIVEDIVLNGYVAGRRRSLAAADVHPVIVVLKSIARETAAVFARRESPDVMNQIPLDRDIGAPEENTVPARRRIRALPPDVMDAVLGEVQVMSPAPIGKRIRAKTFDLETLNGDVVGGS